MPFIIMTIFIHFMLDLHTSTTVASEYISLVPYVLEEKLPLCAHVSFWEHSSTFDLTLRPHIHHIRMLYTLYGLEA